MEHKITFEILKSKEKLIVINMHNINKNYNI
jgi:hypothetical protein